MRARPHSCLENSADILLMQMQGVAPLEPEQRE